MFVFRPLSILSGGVLCVIAPYVVSTTGLLSLYHSSSGFSLVLLSYLRRMLFLRRVSATSLGHACMRVAA